ncbi:hypothetical protein D9M70_637750 [compost metagenome]
MRPLPKGLCPIGQRRVSICQPTAKVLTELFVVVEAKMPGKTEHCGGLHFRFPGHSSHGVQGHFRWIVDDESRCLLQHARQRIELRFDQLLDLLLVHSVSTRLDPDWEL